MDMAGLLAAFASAFTQARRLLSLQLGDGRDFMQRMLPQAVSGEESLSSPYCYRVRCVSPEAGIELKSFLGLPAALGIATAEGGVVTRCGLVTAARTLPGDGGFAAYELTIEPPLALLRHRRASRVFQDQSVPDIVKGLIAEHQRGNPVLAAGFDFRLDLVRKYPARSYCLQYRESDLDLIERLLAEEGISYRFEHGGVEVPHVTCVAFDDPYGLPQAEQAQVRFHRADASETEDSLTAWDSERALGTGEVALSSFDYQQVATLAAADVGSVEQGHQGRRAEASLQDFDAPGAYYGRDQDELARYAVTRQKAYDRAKKGFHGEGTVRALEAGRWFALADHPAYVLDVPESREFVVTALSFTAHNNFPDPLARALGQATSAPYRVQFEAQRRGLPLVPVFAHTGRARPTALGPQTATVVGPADEEIHTDPHGRIKVQFHWQRPAEHPEFGAAFDERSSCWLRVASPSAGARWGHQFIPRIGQEVLVEFLEGDIDRPLVVGVLYNGSHPPPAFSGAGSLPANRTLSGIKSKEYQGSGYNELLFDDSTGELRTRLSSEHAKTQLNLGWLGHPRTDGGAEPRGEGAELRTDAALALRAAQGLLLTAYGRLNAKGEQLARQETTELLDQCAELFRSLAEYAAQHQGLQADPAPQAELAQALKNWENGTNTRKNATGGGAPAICASAPGGLSFSTPQTSVSYAGLNHDITARQHVQLAAGNRLSLNAGAGLSLFTQSGDVRVIAHQGQYLMQAQKNDIVAQAQKNVLLSANDGEVVITAPTLRLVAADGSFIRIGKGITLGTTGSVAIKAASLAMSGPAIDEVKLPAFGSGPVDQRFVLRYPAANSGETQVAANRDFEITLNDGRVVTGTSNAEGQTELLASDAMQMARIRILDAAR